VQLLFLVSSFMQFKDPHICSAKGLLLHWFLLSSFTWMFICTYNMVKVFVNIRDNLSLSQSSQKSFLKYACFAEGLSSCLVIGLVTVSIVKDDTIGYGGNSCYIQRADFILYFVVVPVAIAVVANIVMFVMVIVKVSGLPEMEVGSRTKDRNNMIIFVKLSTITGITWIFGFLHLVIGVSVSEFLYVIFNASQGVFIMTSFVVKQRVYRLLRGRLGYPLDSQTKSTTNHSKGHTSHLTTSPKQKTKSMQT